jgi:Xanthine dehydrogenase, molybdopterin-binding subunit B
MFFLRFQLFAENEVEFAGQIIGAIIADNFKSAYEAAKMVKVVYSDVKTPKLDIKQIVQDGDKARIVEMFKLEPTATKSKFSPDSNARWEILEAGKKLVAI